MKYYMEVRNPQGEWKPTEQDFKLLFQASRAMCNLVDSGVCARIVDACGNVCAMELPHGCEVVWDDTYTTPNVRESGVVYRA